MMIEQIRYADTACIIQAIKTYRIFFNYHRHIFSDTVALELRVCSVFLNSALKIMLLRLWIGSSAYFTRVTLDALE